MSMALQEEEEDGKNHKLIKGKSVSAGYSNSFGLYSRDIDGSDNLKIIFRALKQS